MTHDRLTLDRLVATTPARMWAAWTTPDGLAGWWWRHWPGTTYAVDLRVGGEYRFEATEQGVGVTGEYVELDEPRRLAFTWRWLEDGVPGELEHVVVAFAEEDGGVRVVVDHTGPWTTAEPAENYAQGWRFVLDALEAALSAASTSPSTPRRSG